MSDFSLYKDSHEKQHLRRAYWLPLLRRRKELRQQRIRYLTLPGRELTEIRLFVEGDDPVIEGMSDLVLCERKVFDYYRIARDLPLLKYKQLAEIPTISRGEVEELLLGGHLDMSLPVDAANFDYEGGAWGNHRAEISRKIEALRTLIERQEKHQRAFTLLLTVSGRGSTSALEEVLTDYRSAFSDKTWEGVTGLPSHAKVLDALPVILIHFGASSGFDVQCVGRYTYIGLKTRMLSFALEFDLLPPAGLRSATEQRATTERQRVRETLSQPTIELSWDEAAGIVREEAYDLTVA